MAILKRFFNTGGLVTVAGLVAVTAVAAVTSGCIDQNPDPADTDETAEALGSGPDLVVSSITGPASSNGPLTASVTVCNQGTQSSPSTNVDVHLSTDTTITSADPFVGSAPVPSLNAGQCATVSVMGGAPVPQGAYYLGAIVDPSNNVVELNETNNTLAGALIGIGSGPDLVVPSVTGPASSNGPLTASITVCNQGTQPSPGTNVELHLSTDATITSADPFAGSAPVPNLNAGQCATVSVRGGAPVPQGAYYLGAIVDPGNTVVELIESNNTRAGNLVGIGSGPDLIVSSVTGPASSNGPLTASVVVCNQGTQSSPGTNVELHLSTDATITSGDPFAGSTPVPNLNAGQCVTVSVMGGAPVPQGAYYLGAIVDPTNNVVELIESNNTLAGALVGIGSGPDLIVSGVTGPTSSNGPLTASITVCNQGTQSSPGTNVELHLSADATITAGDPFAGSAPVPNLNAGQCTTVSVMGGAPVPQGAYYLGAIVDPANNVVELIESNNTFAGGLLGIGSGPDLVVSSVTGPASSNGPLTASIVVCNQGTQSSPSTNVELHLSTDATITSADPFAGSAPVPNLNAGQCATASVMGGAPVPEGAYYLGAIVDPANNVVELIESNNTLAGSLIGIGSGPDLVVSSVTAPASSNGPLTASVVVCNQGTQPSPGTIVELHLSTDATITSADPFAGGASVPNLNAGQCATVSVMGGAPVPQGAYYVGAIVDPTNSVLELIESNNTFAGGLVGIGNGPDLIVSSVTGPASSNGPLTASIIVCNQGTQSSPGTSVELHLSTDATITSADPFAGSASVPNLNAGQCATVSVMGGAPVPQGAYYLGGIVDPGNNVFELIESNNTRAGSLIGVGSGPDLIVSSVTGPPSSNGPLTASVIVCNQGTQSSPGTNVELHLSTDATITSADPFAGSASVPNLNAGQCATVSVMGGAPVPQGAYYLGAIVDPTNNVVELIESNNTLAGSLIGIGSGPDLVVSSVTGPASTNGPFTASVIVCNEGTQSSPATNVEIYLSTDSTITSSDTQAGIAPVPNLNAGQCTTVSVMGGAPVPPGAYFLGAIVDPNNSVLELVESNNARAGNVITES